ncbi:hypothetical protein FB107DRAFT_224852 [Schizophyllum commune]
MELSLSQQLDDIATESLEIEPEDIIVMHKQQHVLPVEKKISNTKPGLSQDLNAMLDMSLDFLIEGEGQVRKDKVQIDEEKEEQGGDTFQGAEQHVLPSFSDYSLSSPEIASPPIFAEKIPSRGAPRYKSGTDREDTHRRYRALQQKFLLTEAENSGSEMEPESDADGDAESTKEPDPFISSTPGERSQEGDVYHLGLLSQNVPGGPQFLHPPVRRSLFGGREVLRMERARDRESLQDDDLSDEYEIDSFVTDDEASPSSCE